MAAKLGADQAREQAIELAATLTLPVTARSLTAAEVARIDRRYLPIILGIFFAAALPLLAIFAVAGASGPGSVALLAGAIATLGAILWLIARRRAAARRDYADPEIVVEIGSDKLILRAPGRIEELDYAAIKVELNFARIRSNSYFLGLILETPLGPLRLDDLWFEHGRTAAAALVGRMHKP
jgi:hypothetical protein